jgi:hypothetical protein
VFVKFFLNTSSFLEDEPLDKDGTSTLECEIAAVDASSFEGCLDRVAASITEEHASAVPVDAGGGGGGG